MSRGEIVKSRLGANMETDGHAGRGWQAQLALTFNRAGDKTILARREHAGPLVVQKPLYPEHIRVCHAIIIHPPGGVAGGDQLMLEINVEEGAHTLITTPGAGKWYKANGRQARQTLHIRVAAHAVVEWLPQENIVFDGADVDWQTQVELEQNATWLGWEITCLGRTAGGESFSSGVLANAVSVRRDDRWLWHEQARLAGSSAILNNPVGLGGKPVFGTLLAAGRDAPDSLLEACRAIVVPAGIQTGITRLPGVLAARCLAPGAEATREWLTRVWAQIRPHYAGREAVQPRIWST